MEEADLELQKDLGKAHFQQELNRWFESRGIISDLRSHLRHLMISALQNTQIGLKPTDKTSPKAQALNLIVAEYLFRHGCHYTLSVFTSEVPTLSNFSAINPGMIKCGEKPSETAKKRLQRHCFQEKELEEIFNALGMTSSFEELGHLKARYFQKDYDSSLVEVFLQFFTEMSTKLQVRKTLDRYEVDEGRKLLSEKWSAKVVDILLNEKITSTQIAAIKQAILRVTENEIKRLIVEEHKIQLEILAEREKRIQEYLRKHEEEIFFQLMKAEKDLNERRDMIDEELTDRQKHLTEMALEWNEKHEEILRLSKNFHNIENENVRLQKKVEKLERENENFRAESEAGKKTVEQLRVEISSLTSRLKEVTQSNVILNERIEVLISRENKELSASHNTEEENITKNLLQSSLLLPLKKMSDNENSHGIKESIESEQKLQNAVKVRDNSQFQEWNASPVVKSHFGSGDTNQKSNIDQSEDENESSSNSFSCDIIISNVRKNLQALEEESDRINKNYLDYKLKSRNIDSDSEISVAGSEKSQEKMLSPRAYTEVIKESRFCQTISPDMNVENIFRVKTSEETKGLSDIFNQKQTEKSVDISLKEPEMRTPTKRQQQNREFFLKSRQLLQEFEKQNALELNAETPSLMESSFQNFTSSSSEEIENFENIRESVKRSSKEPALLTPLRTVSFYSNEEPDIRKEPNAEEVSSKREATEIRFNELVRDDRIRLALLEETRIKTPQASARKLLRQQILQLESDAEDEKQKSKEDKSNESPKSTYSGNMSVGRKSGSDGVW